MHNQPLVKVKHIHCCTYDVYFTAEARKVYPHGRIKLNTKELTVREPGEFERSHKLNQGRTQMYSSTDISGNYLLEEDEGVYYLTLIE